MTARSVPTRERAGDPPSPSTSLPEAYRGLADFYDPIYRARSYRREVAILRRIATRYGRSNGRRWVDVACGTGEHLRLLRRRYAVEGVDASREMLRIARRKNPGVRFLRADMRRFSLRHPADVVSCLFSAIGYLPDERALRAAFRAIYRGLRPGGVALIEPWLDPEQIRPGHVGLTTVRGPGWAVARMNVVQRRGYRTTMDMHYLIGDQKRVRHVVDRNVCRMTPHRRLVELLQAVGFRARLDRRSMPLGRGLLIAVRPIDDRGPRPGRMSPQPPARGTSDRPVPQGSPGR